MTATRPQAFLQGLKLPSFGGSQQLKTNERQKRKEEVDRLNNAAYLASMLAHGASDLAHFFA
jgi:hypothetical protein